MKIKIVYIHCLPIKWEASPYNGQNFAYKDSAMGCIKAQNMGFLRIFVELGIHHLSKVAAISYVHAEVEIVASNHPSLIPKPVEIQLKKNARFRFRPQGTFEQDFIKLGVGSVLILFANSQFNHLNQSIFLGAS